MAPRSTVLEIDGREVVVTNPDKVYFPQTGHTKLDLVHYYLTVAEGALRGVDGRPMALKRFVNGVDAEPFFQKRAPTKRPDWIETVELHYPSGRTAEEIVVRTVAQLAWVVNLGCVDLNPHPVRAADVDRPDELRVDLDPLPGVAWEDVRQVALVTRDVLADFGLVGWPKTSGSRGFHVFCRIAPRWTFPEVRRAAMALARAVERRAPELATSKWWKEERHGVFVDYNQNAKDHTTASAYSVRPTPLARVSAPLDWAEVATCEPDAYTLATMPGRYLAVGDPGEGIDAAVGSLEGLLAQAQRDAEAGLDEGRTSGGTVPAAAPGKRAGPTGRRRTTAPLIEVARAATVAEGLAGLERWKARHAGIVRWLAADDVLIDNMRGRSTTWTRVRVNLRHVPEAERPGQGELEVDFEPQWGAPGADWRGG